MGPEMATGSADLMGNDRKNPWSTAISGSSIGGTCHRKKAYFSGNIPRKYGQKYGTFTYLSYRILKFPLN
jgi:hypothetical protein